MKRHNISAALTRCFFACLLLCLFALPAQAMPGQAQDKAPVDRFAVMDKNSDGKVTLEEFLAAFPGMREEAFKAIDKNGDTFIIREEWDAFAAEHSKGMKPSGMSQQQQREGMNNMPGGDPLIPAPGSAGLPLVTPPLGR